MTTVWWPVTDRDVDDVVWLPVTDGDVADMVWLPVTVGDVDDAEVRVDVPDANDVVDSDADTGNATGSMMITSAEDDWVASLGLSVSYDGRLGSLADAPGTLEPPLRCAEQTKTPYEILLMLPIACAVQNARGQAVHDLTLAPVRAQTAH